MAGVGGMLCRSLRRTVPLDHITHSRSTPPSKSAVSTPRSEIEKKSAEIESDSSASTSTIDYGDIVITVKRKRSNTKNGANKIKMKNLKVMQSDESTQSDSATTSSSSSSVESEKKNSKKQQKHKKKKKKLASKSFRDIFDE